MIKKITCIDCPVGCQMEVDVEGGHMIKLTGNKCEKGEHYAQQEIENPMRILSSTVLTKGLNIKLVPVKTDQPIPKSKIFAALEETKKVKLEKPVKVGEVIIKDLLNLGVNLIATRNAILL